MEQVKKECEIKNWRYWDNGLPGGQLQINVTVGNDTFSWWPLSAKGTCWNKKLPGIPGGSKVDKYATKSSEQFINWIESRLRSLYP